MRHPLVSRSRLQALPNARVEAGNPEDVDPLAPVYGIGAAKGRLARVGPPPTTQDFGGWHLAYQYVREPRTAAESDRLSNACETTTERLVVWTLLDTGLRVGELCDLTPRNVLWHQRQLRIKARTAPTANGPRSASCRCRPACGPSWSTTSPSRRGSRSSSGGPRTSSGRWPTARGSPGT